MTAGPSIDAEDVAAGLNDAVIDSGDMADPKDRKRVRGKSSSPAVVSNFHPICG